jgi:hypothetical protein
MRATELVLSFMMLAGAIATGLIAPPSDARDAASKDAAKLAAGVHLPQPQPDVRRDEPPDPCRRFHSVAAHARCVTQARICAAAQAKPEPERSRYLAANPSVRCPR